MIVEYAGANVVYDAVGLARIDAMTSDEGLVWNGSLPFVDGGELRSAFQPPVPQTIEFESLITVPEGECWHERTHAVYAYSRTVLEAGDVTIPGWTAVIVPPYGGAVNARGYHVAVLTCPEGFGGRSVTLTSTKPLARVFGLNDTSETVGSGGFLRGPEGELLLDPDGNKLEVGSG